MQQIFFSLDRVGFKASFASIQTVRKNLRLRGIKSVMVIGSYKGTVETTFCVEVNNNKDVEYIKMLCRMFSQESFLVVNNNCQATLHFVNTNEASPIGMFQAVGKDVAMKLDAWTYNAHTDTYFAVKGA